MSEQPSINEIDRRVLEVLDGRDRLKALLRERGMSIADFARKHDFWTQEVSRCISGERHLPEIRDTLARELGLTRAEVDALIGSRLDAA